MIKKSNNGEIVQIYSNISGHNGLGELLAWLTDFTMREHIYNFPLDWIKHKNTEQGKFYYCNFTGKYYEVAKNAGVTE
ncbi:MAG: hypothetical protein WC310_05905 [Patescibacteria group bacterium]|jgi:hypothetical protein